MGDPTQITPFQIIDGRGGVTTPGIGFKLFTYAAGTNTPLATYTDASLGTPNTNPVLMNQAGYAVNGSTITGVWVGPASYKFVLKDASDVTVWTQDNIQDQGQALKALLAGATGAAQIGYKYSSSATTRTVQAKLRESASVLDFGADPTGVLDSLAAFVAAYAAADTVNVPAGTYTLSGEFSMTRAATALIGAGSRSTIIQYTGSSLIRSVVRVAAAGGDFLIQNAYIKGNNHCTYAFFSDGSNGSLFDNLRIEGGLTAAAYNGTGVANQWNNLEIHARTPSTVLVGLLLENSNTTTIINPNIDGLRVSVSGTDGIGISNGTGTIETSIYGGTSEGNHINLYNAAGAILNVHGMDNEESDISLEDHGQSHIFGGSYLGGVWHYTSTALSSSVYSATISDAVTIDSGAKLVKVYDSVLYVALTNNGTGTMLHGNTAASGAGLGIAELFGCGGIDFQAGINMVIESAALGANNAIVGGYTPARGDGSQVTSAYPVGLPLRKGMDFYIQLNHTLQAGANTYDFQDGTGPHAIRKASDYSQNLGSGYPVGGIIHLWWYADQGVFVDLAQ